MLLSVTAEDIAAANRPRSVRAAEHYYRNLKHLPEPQAWLAAAKLAMVETSLDCCLRRMGATRGTDRRRDVKLKNGTKWVLSDESLNDEALPHKTPWEAVLLPDPLRPRMELVETPTPFGETLQSLVEVWP